MKRGRPKSSKSELKCKTLQVRLTVDQWEALEKTASGCDSASAWARAVLIGVSVALGNPPSN